MPLFLQLLNRLGWQIYVPANYKYFDFHGNVKSVKSLPVIMQANDFAKSIAPSPGGMAYPSQAMSKQVKMQWINMKTMKLLKAKRISVLPEGVNL